MQSAAKSVPEYLAELPEDRRQTIETVRQVILDHLPAGYEEVMYGMIGYVVPLTAYPAGYLGNPTVPLSYAGLASQKNYCSLYLMCVYGDPKIKEWFEAEFKKSGKKLDMGKSCIRFKTAADLPLELIGETIARVPMSKYIEMYRSVKDDNGRTKKPRSN